MQRTVERHLQNAYAKLGLQGRTRVLSSPRVSTLHNQKAIIKAGTDEFFITGVNTDVVVGDQVVAFAGAASLIKGAKAK